jgi:hypothetical protein
MLGGITKICTHHRPSYYPHLDLHTMHLRMQDLGGEDYFQQLEKAVKICCGMCWKESEEN